MYLRFVRLKIKEEKVWETKKFYEEHVIPQLEQTDGCVFASLLQGTIHGDDHLSVTAWTSADAAADYVRSGLFDRLLDESDELLQEAEEWTTDLPGAGDAVVFTGAEPEVETWELSGVEDAEALDRVVGGRVYIRMVAARLRHGAFEEFARRFESEVRPALAETPGCVGAFLVAGTGDTDRVLSVTMWAREEDAVRYGLSGEFERLSLRLKDTFSDLYQWNIALSGDPLIAETTPSRSLDVEGFHLVIGRKLSE
ncbi:MAG: antibiotic biosynthesis monooxygenase [Thermoanaerobaculales bacterium]|nr:antibiotic biosynthesis monooxygenase [Thermoanaerobaculales bacterium]